MPRGGFRPGSGRKPKSFQDARKRWEAIFFASIVEEDVKEATLRWIGKLKAGDPQAAFLWDRLLGKVKDEQTVEHSGEVVVRVVRDRINPAPVRPAPDAGADTG